MKRKKKREKKNSGSFLSGWALVSGQQLFLRPLSQTPFSLDSHINFVFSHSRQRPCSSNHVPEEEGKNRNTAEALLVDTRKRATALLTATFTKSRFFSTPIQTLYFHIPVSGHAPVLHVPKVFAYESFQSKSPLTNLS